MALEAVDFQSIIHQHVTQLIGQWQEAGFSEEEIQETASQFFNMGMIAGQQIQQEGSIPIQGTDKTLPYTENMAQQIVTHFLNGLHPAILKAHETGLPSQEKWQFMQNVAYHVFEQSKQVALVTLDQEKTPDIQISDEQINGWLAQTAVEALMYYVLEYEKQNGPITRTNQQDSMAGMPSVLPEQQPVLNEPMMDDSWDEPEPMQGPGEPMMTPPPPPPPPVAPVIPEIHHKYAAVGLLLSSLPTTKQRKILSAFTPDEQVIIQNYRDPDMIARHLDLGLVAKHLNLIRQKLGQGKTGAKSQYASAANHIIQQLPAPRLERLFQNERPLVKGYIRQFTQATDNRRMNPYNLPPGVEESLIRYLQRNFPNEVSVG